MRILLNYLFQSSTFSLQKAFYFIELSDFIKKTEINLGLLTHFLL